MSIDSDSGDQAVGDEATFRRISAQEICSCVENISLKNSVTGKVTGTEAI